VVLDVASIVKTFTLFGLIYFLYITPTPAKAQ